MRAGLAIAALIVALSAAHAFGLGKEGAMFGRMGIVSNTKTSSPVVPCSGTGLIFTSACNSQYIGIL